MSTWIGSKYATNTISGTSMASPHIAGLLAYLLSLQPSKDSAYAVADITPKKLKAVLLATATKNVLTDVPSDTTNLLAWNGGGISNYSAIVEAGDYDAKVTNEYKITIPSVETIEKEVKNVIPSKDALREIVHEVVDEVVSELRSTW